MDERFHYTFSFRFCLLIASAEVLKVLLEQNVSKGAWVGLFFSVTHRGRTKRYALVQSL